MAAIRSSGTWGSALTADEFAAIRSVGFEPVGQVFGAAVYDAGAAIGYSCPGASGVPGALVAPGAPPSSGRRAPTGSATRVSGQGGAGSFAPLVQAMDQAR